MQQSISSGQPKRMQGALMILGAVAVGVGSGVGLNFVRPDHKDPLSAAEHTQQEERAEAQSSASPEPAVAENAAPSIDESAVAEPAAEPEAAPSFDASEPSEQTASSDAGATTEAEAESGADSTSGASIASVEPSEAPAIEDQQAQPQDAASTRVASPGNRAAPPPAAQVLRPWWSSTSSDSFGVQYVGQVEGQRAVAVLFSGDVGNPNALGNALKLVDESGQTIPGGWKLGNNPRLIVHSDLKPGRYTLAIDGQLASASGQSLRAPLRGPVYIQ